MADLLGGSQDGLAPTLDITVSGVYADWRPNQVPEKKLKLSRLEGSNP